MIENLREQRATYAAVEREARDTDRVTVDFDGTIDGQPFEGGKGEHIAIVLGAGRMLADFEAGLKAARPGEQKTIDLTFPQNYAAPALAGKKAQFAVTVKLVEERQLPELNDEFSASYGVPEGGVERLRQEVQENMERELAEAIRVRIKNQVMDTLLSSNPLELPKVAIDAQVRDLQMEAARRMGAQDPAQLPPPQTFQDNARRRVALSLLINEVIKAGEIQVNSSLVQSRFQELAQQHPDPQHALRIFHGNPQMTRQMQASVLEDQAVDWILERAKISDKPSSFKELMNFGA
jgi:trigger factor